MTKEKTLICFDLDDTLIDDNYKFELTFCDCIRTIIVALETRSPAIDTILQTARDIDNKNWETWPADRKYMPGRVASSWVSAYEELAISLNIPVRNHVKRLIWALVMTNFDPPYFVIPGVIETLTELKKRGYQMHALTIGHNVIQRRKLTVTKLIKFFDEVHIVKSDKLPVLKNLFEKNKNVVMVGNSMRTDINPALEAGIPAYYMARGNWHGFKSTPLNNNFTEIKDIRDLLKFFD